jgi:SHS family sialic acid transporter-like MFS transporter
VSNRVLDNASPYPSAVAGETLEADPYAPTRRTKNLVLAAAFLGWMFDGLEMGIFPQIAKPALTNLLSGQHLDKAALDAAIKHWNVIIDALFLFGAAFGGLVFGWLGDKIGRVKAMSMSILVYSAFTGLLYFVTTPTQIASLRFIAAVGMGGEWALGVALVMEVWDAKHRPILAGAIGAASNVGFVLVGVLAFLHPVTEASWRWVVLAGAAPAVITFMIQIFVPESHKWKESQKQAPSKPLTELFGTPGLSKRAFLAIIFASVALLGTWGAVQKIPTWVSIGEVSGFSKNARPFTQILSGLGAIVGCLLAPLIAAKLNRRTAYFLLCLGSFISCEWLFYGFTSYGPALLIMVMIVGAMSAAFYGWLPLYLPELFPTRVRATAQGIAFNSGRILAAIGSISLGQMTGGFARMGMIVSSVYLVGMAVIWLAPETKGRPLPD